MVILTFIHLKVIPTRKEISTDAYCTFPRTRRDLYGILQDASNGVSFLSGPRSDFERSHFSTIRTSVCLAIGIAFHLCLVFVPTAVDAVDTSSVVLDGMLGRHVRHTVPSGIALRSIRFSFVAVRVSLRRPAVSTSAVESTTASASLQRTGGVSEDAKPSTRPHEALNCAASEEQTRGDNPDQCFHRTKRTLAFLMSNERVFLKEKHTADDSLTNASQTREKKG